MSSGCAQLCCVGADQRVRTWGKFGRMLRAATKHSAPRSSSLRSRYITPALLYLLEASNGDGQRHCSTAVASDNAD